MEILPLFKHKHIKVTKNTSTYTIQCLQNDIRPGVYAVVNVVPRTWYYVETICSKSGTGRPGIWIGTPIKRTLFYGEKVMDSRKTYIRKSFFTSNFNKLLIGLLIENSNPTSRCTIEKFIVKKKQVDDEDYYKTDEDIYAENVSSEKFNEEFRSFNDILFDDIPVDTRYSTILDVNYQYNTEYERVGYEKVEYERVEHERVENPIYTISKKYNLLEIQKNIYPVKKMFPIQLGIPFENMSNSLDIKDMGKEYSVAYTTKMKPIECIKGLSKGYYIKNIPTELFPFVYNDLQYTSLSKDTKYKIQEIFKYSKEFVSTVALVKYIENMIKKKGKEILVLVDNLHGNVSDIHLSILHGYKSYIGNKNVIDYPKCSELYKNNFYHIDDTDVNRSRILKRIELHHFTYIVVLSSHSEYQMKETIEKYYYNNEIVFIDTNIKNTKNKGIYFTNKILL